MGFKQGVLSVTYTSGRAEIPMSDFDSINNFTGVIGVIASLMDTSSDYFVSQANVVDRTTVVIIIRDTNNIKPSSLTVWTSILLYGLVD